MARNQMLLSAQELTEKWKNRASAAVPDIVRSINNVKENPAELAMAKKDKWISGINQAAADGRWEAGLSKVTLADWKTKTAQKVQERYASGVNAAQEKHRQFSNYLVQTVNTGMQQVNQMPDMTLQDRLNKMVAWANYMHGNPYKG